MRSMLNDDDRVEMLVENDGVLFHRREEADGQQVWRYVVPQQQMTMVLDSIHGCVYGGHLGIDKTTEKFTSRFLRPQYRTAIKNYIRECDVCQRVKAANRKVRAPLKPLRPILPLELLTTDLSGALPETERKNKYVLVVCDHMTKFVQMYALNETSAPTVANKLVEFMCQFGMSDSILSDQGRNYQSTLLEAVYELLDVKRLRTTAYHPECDGMSERFMRTLKAMLASLVDEWQTNWDLLLPQLAFAYNTSVHNTTKQTPFELMFGRKPKIPIDLVLGTRTEVTYTAANPHITHAPHKVAAQYVSELTDRLQAAYSFARGNRDLTMDRAKLNHDRIIKPATYFAGDLVLLTNPIVKEGQSSKLAHKWKGPYKVVQKVNEEGYIIRKVDALFEFLPRSKNQRVHHNRLKRYFPGGPLTLNETAANDVSTATPAVPPTTTLLRVGRRNRARNRSLPPSTPSVATVEHEPVLPTSTLVNDNSTATGSSTVLPSALPPMMTAEERYELLCQKRASNNPNKKRKYTKRNQNNKTTSTTTPPSTSSAI